MRVNATPPPSAAAFVRVEETLLPSRLLGSTLYVGLQAPGVTQPVKRLGWLAAAPALGVLNRLDRRRGRRLAHYALRGLSLARIETLAAEYYEQKLEGELRAEGLEAIARAKEAGLRVFLFSRGLSACLAPLVARVGAEALIGSEPELRDGVATGRLIEPDDDWAERLAQRERLALAASYAYGGDLADATLLEAVGFPCAVNPDPALRGRARDAGWPVLDVAGRA